MSESPILPRLTEKQREEVKHFARRRRLAPEAAAKILFNRGWITQQKNEGNDDKTH